MPTMLSRFFFSRRHSLPAADAAPRRLGGITPPMAPVRRSAPPDSGWFDSSWELRHGLTVIEDNDAAPTPPDAQRGGAL
ncbi:MAG: hypothetical protein HY021_06085 [Burkholderiales bacterium]|nr:hypothetical protein [Burkholderiales bacterium]